MSEVSALAVGAGRRVTLHFALKLDDGQVVDSNFDGQPVTFVVGDGNLPEGFEQVLSGMSAGDEGVFRIPPSRAFGMPNPTNHQTFPRSRFASDIELQNGLVMSFKDAANSELAGVVTDFDDERVNVDFNHPLAGKELLFQVRVIQVENS
ncbi:peptidylprolyl isomerase [Endozoicomonas montiporae]|uniref:Peptidyl-prolyl cis-trans isomerase n=3 Tax=Endozoicomonas montiporae TaxID=1027273 RepID=A0A081N7M8_9GAMM|nr:peptidylprolyl isomerase [Endozoicomonas montiporae]AMO55699.1 FKBP-type peptidyl-prolyl cis-trans isomerase [Endozoicomonas montiporae CL-33]KEQ14451.1 peptidylprolyl isomerase [Endozoicomonas montiporae]